MNGTRKKSLLRAAVILCVAVAAAAALFVVGKWEKMEVPSDTPDTDDRPEFYYDGAWYTQNTALETLLIAGIDKYSDQLAETLELGKELDANINTQQSDFLMLLVLDKTRNTCTVLPLNRDTMTQINALGLAGEAPSPDSWRWLTPTAAAVWTAATTRYRRSPTCCTAYRSTISSR